MWAVLSGVEFHHKNITHVPGQIYNFSENLQCIPGVTIILLEENDRIVLYYQKEKDKKYKYSVKMIDKER